MLELEMIVHATGGSMAPDKAGSTGLARGLVTTQLIEVSLQC